MKLRIAFALWSLVVLTLLASCATTNSPQGVAQGLLTAINGLDYAKAKSYADANALNTINAIEALTASLTEKNAAIKSSQKITIASIEEKEGETLVSYSIGDHAAILSAKKVGDDWKVTKLGYELVAYLIQNTPAAVVEAFITALDSFNIEMSIPLADPETQTSLKSVADKIQDIDPEVLAKAPKLDHPSILDVSENGDTAAVRYKVGKEDVADLVKVNGVWKITLKTGGD